MKKNVFTIIVLSILFFCVPHTVEAQFGKFVKKAKKAKNKVEKTIHSAKTEKATQQQEETPVLQKTKAKNKDESTESHQPQKVSSNPEHQSAVSSFLSFITGPNGFLQGGTNYKQLSYFKQIYKFDLEEAMYVISEDNFEGKRMLEEIPDLVNNPTYSEERYLLIDLLYRNEINHREKYPNQTTNEWGNIGAYKKTEETYQLFKFIQDYLVKDNANFGAEVAYAKKKMDKINEKFEARLNSIAINDVHKANLYKVIFTSNRNIDPKTAPASEYKTTFKPGEEIFAVAMVDKPLNKKLIKQGNPHLQMTTSLNDRIETVVEHQMFPIKPNQKYFVFPIVVKSSNFKCSDTEATANTEYAMRWLSKKEDRRFKINVWLKEGNDYHNSSGSLEGTFTYDASDGNGAVVKKMANQVAAKCGRE